MRSATRQPMERDGALRLLQGAAEVLVARGRSVRRFALTGEGASAPAEVVGFLLGRTGKLRAPTLKVGDRLVVGYNKELLERVFG